jgi:hypothetical protein
MKLLLKAVGPGDIWDLRGRLVVVDINQSNLAGRGLTAYGSPTSSTGRSIRQILYYSRPLPTSPIARPIAGRTHLGRQGYLNILTRIFI